MPNPLHPYYLQQMGIETWLMRQPVTFPEPQLIKLMILGDALDTDNKAASLLNKMLSSIDLSPEEICIKSSLTDDLIQQITTKCPQLLLALGNTAIQFLLNDASPLNELRSKTHDYQGQAFVVSYHPTDLLQQPADKKYAYQDLLYIQKILAQKAC